MPRSVTIKIPCEPIQMEQVRARAFQKHCRAKCNGTCDPHVGSGQQPVGSCKKPCNAIATVYKPTKPRAYQDEIVRPIARTTMRGRPQLEGPLGMFVTFYVARPKALLKKSSPKGAIPCPVWPDLKNYVWLIEDACQGIVFHNDSRIWIHVPVKVYVPIGVHPQTVATFAECADVGLASRLWREVNYALTWEEKSPPSGENSQSEAAPNGTLFDGAAPSPEVK